MLRITLGVILLATWFENVGDDLYTAAGFEGFLNWLDAPDGNASSLGFVHSVLDTIVAPAAGFFGGVQLVVELLIGLCLVLGLFTRLASLLASAFFASLFLAYFGGHEWIWTYVLLFMAGLTVFLGYGGRRIGVDQALVASRGESPAHNLFW